MIKRAVIALLALAVGAGAFFYLTRDTRHDVVMRHAAEFTAIRGQLARLAAVIKPPPPPPRRIPATHCDGVPPEPFKYDHDDLTGTNTGLVTYDQLKNPSAPAGKWSVTTTDLAHYVAAATPGYRPTDADKQRADDAYTRSVETMAKVRYVVAVWTNHSEGFEQNGPWDDTLGVEAHIADLRTGKSLCFVHAAGGLSDRVHYAYPRDGGPGAQREHATEAIENNLRAAGATAFEQKLNTLGHGPFNLPTP
ncbi:hypothetical protein [Actinomadura rugatobispora]|uniref:Uncharacterized protein n=1 Tax=Actinomadura rugatobispora TaxID=1994 RepID=A0ABW1A3K2_9ACTN|nr:hypothetical protein GCM10010200_011790 [Actinomadura rugatobispora]